MAPSVGRTIGNALGKLFRNLRSPQWVAAELGKIGVAQVFVDPLGHRVKALLLGHFHDDGGKLGDHYKDTNGNEYIVVNGKKYRHDVASDTFSAAD